MWFLWFYLISLLLCVIVLLTIARATKNKIKRECPELKVKNKNKKSWTEILVSFMPFMVPFLNLIFLVCIMLQSQKVTEETIKKLKNENK